MLRLKKKLAISLVIMAALTFIYNWSPEGRRMVEVVVRCAVTRDCDVVDWARKAVTVIAAGWGSLR